VFPQIHANQTNLRGEVGFFEKTKFFPRKFDKFTNLREKKIFELKRRILRSKLLRLFRFLRLREFVETPSLHELNFTNILN
jgi:hypothetical protein